ncbi:DUF805 domain-containing protein [Uliginosibacterium gangwonense]|uniref:DUF805 domain-containing protein n=1 Tax=Uliginosibacterium gangwonense TaxID=392736 RepID=UPI0012FB6DE4|nr:DUF805 domain-containing protein [Uliginosibacterium gangwonense]
MFKIRFSGQCLPGFEESQVRSLLEQRGAFSAAQLNAVFRGGPVTLKQGLPLEKAAHYLAQLRKIGMDVAVEPDTSHTAPATTPSASQDTQAQQATQPRPNNAAEHICPRCGSMRLAGQPCSVCLGKTAQPKPAAAPQPVQAPPQVTETPDDSTDRTTLWGLSFFGRMNPAHYLLATFGAYLIQDIFHGEKFIALLAGAKIPDPGLFSLLACAFFVFQLTRVSALRLHDLGLPGFLAVAYVALCGFCGKTFGTHMGLNLLQCGVLLLAVLPSAGRNKYGWTPSAIGKPFEWYAPGIRANRVFFLSRIFSVLSIWVAFSLFNIFILGFFLRLFGASPITFAAANFLVTGYTLQLFLARIHDIGMSGRWLILYGILTMIRVLMASSLQLGGVGTLLVLLIVLIEIIIFIMLAVMSGQSSDNRFGPAPAACSTRALWGNLIFLILISAHLILRIADSGAFQKLQMLH